MKKKGSSRPKNFLFGASDLFFNDKNVHQLCVSKSFTTLSFAEIGRESIQKSGRRKERKMASCSAEASSVRRHNHSIIMGWFEGMKLHCPERKGVKPKNFVVDSTQRLPCSKVRPHT